MFYKITNLFTILDYGKSVAQDDLFKLQCVRQVISQSLVINRDTDAYACSSSFSLYRSCDQQNKKCKLVNYCKSDRAACFELPEPWYRRDMYQESWKSYSDRSMSHY